MFKDMLKQAQAMQGKLAEAQNQLAELEIHGAAGGGLVRVTLKGTGALVGLAWEDSLKTPEDKEILADLIIAAHADAKKKLEEAQADLMRETMGPLANLPGMPKL